MAKRRGSIMYLEYHAFRVASMVFRAMPIDMALAVARWISPIVYLLHAQHRRVAVDNLRHAFGHEMNEGEIRRIARRAYAHLVMVGVEVLKMGDTLKASTLSRYVEIENRHIVDALAASGRGAIFVTGHFGNWEMNAYILQLIDHPLHTVAWPLDNPMLDAYVKKHRARMGRRIVAAYATELEEHIRRRPEQWLWNHRRWKTRPPEEREVPQAEKVSA